MNINMNDIEDFPSAQAEEIQKHLLELDIKNKLKEEFLNRYGNNLGKPNSLANYILKHWNEKGKRLYLEYTGIEVYDDKYTIAAIGIKLNEVTYGSHKYILWKCNKCQHEWVVRTHDRIGKNSNCPACSGTRLIKGKNDLETFCKQHSEYQKLLTEFMNKDINDNKILPSEISRSNNDKVWWHCSNPDCNHEWLASPNSRTKSNRGSGCPACSGTRLIKGVNDLETFCKQHSEFSKLLTEFMNEDIDGNRILPSEISRASDKKVLWHCSNPDCNHDWYTTIGSRTSAKSGCPICDNRRKAEAAHLKGEPLDEWCDKQGAYGAKLKSEFIGLDKDNQPIKISEVSMGSHDAIQWKCNKCHKIWITSPNSRTKSKSGCPYCNICGTSFPEQYIYHSLKQLFPDTLNRAKDPIKNYEFDIAIPSLKLCIEYSGYNWHADNIKHDIEKEVHCKSHNVQFLQIYSHYGEIKDTDGDIAQDSYEKNQILYKVNTDKTLHIIQLQQIIKFILQEYAPNHSIEEINFELAERQANEVMGKA